MYSQVVEFEELYLVAETYLQILTLVLNKLDNNTLTIENV